MRACSATLSAHVWRNKRKTWDRYRRDAQIVNACFHGGCSALVRAISPDGCKVLVRNYWINTLCANAARTALIVPTRLALRRVIMLEFLRACAAVFIFFRSLLSRKFDRRLKRRLTRSARP